ncbi:LysR family transcriptional regulator [Novosphingobium beihaiensis]|uniref:LysR family transcriptional regulator n=1 Tax=Novosphingobium beihaiensis TaxID=2930389 RepID=A0ABT0BUN5_9SPHN|nr:LysR family transcriptional regulator [Novosphingobium beihaiensis]MCJ2188583.1 LysR family transcriptional regulator [Novosphingobium beihaiensis]
MNWDDLRYFRALAATGSLSAAARMLGVEHATVSRRIVSLESDLGLALADRRGRRWSLTRDGERIAALAERVEHETQAIRRAADGVRSNLSGTVTISAPPALAAGITAASLADLQRQHPRLAVRIIGEARTASLDRSEADIAIRLTRPESGDLTIAKLARMDFRLYASPGYLAGVAERDWRFIGYTEPAPQQAALEAFAKARPFCLYASSLEIQQGAARSGAGVAALPDFMALPDAGLAPATPGRILISRDIWLVVHSDLKRNAAVQAVTKRLRDAFSQDWPH